MHALKTVLVHKISNAKNECALKSVSFTFNGWPLPTLFRFEIYERQILFEMHSLSENLSCGIGGKTSAVKNEFVLPADHIDIHHRSPKRLRGLTHLTPSILSLL